MERHFYLIRFISPKIVINLQGPTRNYSVKEKHIESVVSEINRYRQTEKHPVTVIPMVILIIKKI